MAIKSKKTSRARSAFLLLEAELSVVILLTIIVVVVSSLSHLLKTQRDNDHYLSAIMLADDKLSEMQAYGLDQIEESGDFGNSSFSWSYSGVVSEDISNITQLDLSISWEREPRPVRFSVTTYLPYIENE